jgi:hypothetical protein
MLCFFFVSCFFAIGTWSAPNSQAQTSTCDYTSRSLNPTAFAPDESNYLNNVLLAPNFSVPVFAVNSANQLQYATFFSRSAIKASNPETVSVTQFNFSTSNPIFPPTGYPGVGYPDVPRLFLANKTTISEFYSYVTNMSATQSSFVQNLYLIDLGARRNFALNVANLGRDLTSLRQTIVAQYDISDPSVFDVIAAIDQALSDLRSAYNILGNTTLAAPNPRDLYKSVTMAYSNTLNSPIVKINLSRLKIGLNILAIGISNYETNRLPAPGSKNRLSNSCPSGCFPLQYATFDAAISVPLSVAQSNPGIVFRSQVVSLLNTIGITTVASVTFLTYQVNSADALQFVAIPATTSLSVSPDLGSLKIYYTPTPQFAFNDSARKYLQLSVNSATNQQNLVTYYANPANSARRTNYGTNLQNLICAFQQLQSGASLPTEATDAVNNALFTLINARNTLQSGGLPDILATYKTVGSAIETIIATLLPTPIDNIYNLTPPPPEQLNVVNILKTIDRSLLPIGVINYYFVPLTQ